MSSWNIESVDTMIDAGVEPPPESGEHHIMDVLERDFERESRNAPSALIEGLSPAPVLAEVKIIDVGGDKYPDLSHLTTKKIPHKNLVIDGVCDHCGHCGHELSDSISIQAGVGPVCRRRGYAEDPMDGDEVQAMVDLAEFPELVDFLTEHYRPLGIRGLVNGLVRVASLNRPRGRGQKDGNAKVFTACCDSIESLGHRKMAALLRETMVVVTAGPDEENPGCWMVHVKSREWTKEWTDALGRGTWGMFVSKKKRSAIVPIHKAGDESLPAMTGRTGVDGKPVSNKRALWELLRSFFPGLVVKVGGKTVKIPKAGK